MDNLDHYTEEDFQNYMDGEFMGNIELFQSHINECPGCNKALATYTELYHFINEDFKLETLKIDLASVVVERVFEEKKTHSFFAIIMNVLMALVMITCLVYCIKSLIFIPVQYLLFLIPVALYLILAYKESSFLAKKYEKAVLS